MKVVLSWLRELCPTELAPDELAEILTGVGVKVEEILRPWDGLRDVVAARVLEVRDHPDSDTLCLARISAGSAEREVVVGVRNMVAGDVVPYAGPGARVPALDEPLAERTIRGQRSEGMLCSPRELNVADVHEGILVLDPDVAPGADVKAVLGLEDDAVFDIEIEPNRPDLMSVVGVAREAALVTGVPYSPPDTTLRESNENAADAAELEVRDPEGCPHYLARILRGARRAPSPIPVQARLSASGMRPISAIVDATNYAMLELGQPLHAFDLTKLNGPAIVVRRAAEGETLETLDGIERSLTPEDLLITDRGRAVAIAGVMGSAVAEVTETSSDLLLESAAFAPTGVLRTVRRLGLSTEASARFERGTDPEAVPAAAARAATLIAAWTGASVSAGVLERGDIPPRRHVAVRASRATRVLGSDVEPPRVAEVFDRLGFATRVEGDRVDVEVPGYRVDVDREEDLIEEIARVIGYDAVGSTLPAVRQAGGVPAGYAFRSRVRELLVRAGLREVALLSFASPEDATWGGSDEPVRIANPLSDEQGLLRTRLLPGLVHAAARNDARGVRSVPIFETGTVFARGGSGSASVVERSHVAFLLTGQVVPGWHGDDRGFDVFDATGTLEALLRGAGAGPAALGEPVGPPLHPARSARVVLKGVDAGIVGELHPRAIADADLTGRVAVCELDLDVLHAHASGGVELTDIPRFPPARRDLAFVVDEDVPAAAVRAAIESAAGPLLHGLLLFDVFTGGNVPPGSRSLAFSVDFRAPDRTLTDDEADAAVEAIVSHLADALAARLRASD